MLIQSKTVSAGAKTIERGTQGLLSPFATALPAPSIFYEDCLEILNFEAV